MRALFFISFLACVLYACKSVEDTDGKPLTHSPQGEVAISISGQVIKVDFSLDLNMKGVIKSEISQNKTANIKTRKELISYYKTLPPYFQPGYSSLRNDNEYVFARVEYLLAQECFQDDCSSETRRDVLETVLDMQKHKYGVEYIAPFFARRTGIFLISTILIKEKDESFIQSLIDNTELRKSLTCLNNDTWMDDEEYNNLFLQFAESYLGNY